MSSSLRFRVFSFLLLALAGAARAETINCTVIDALTYVINAPGIYCLKSDLSVAGGNGIVIISNDVVVDLNGHSITGTGTRTGVEASSGLRNITVRNGTIRRFERGVDLDVGGDVALVEDLRIEAHADMGILARGRASVVRRNQIVQNGITGAGERVGIWVNGPGAIVADNQVVDIGLGAPGQVHAIRVQYGAGSVVQGNVVSNSSAAGFSGNGVHFESSIGGAAIGNRISGMNMGIVFSSDSTGIYMDNTVGGAETPFSGGTAAGRTNFAF